MNATTLQFNQAKWRNTKGPTLEKILTDAPGASFPALLQVIWKFTWWGSIQGKSRTSVTSATSLALQPVICSSTWGRTLGRSLSSATDAAKLSRNNITLKNMSKSTWPESVCESCRSDCLSFLFILLIYDSYSNSKIQKDALKKKVHPMISSNPQDIANWKACLDTWK